jgi:two-component system NtrC family sensor kinase
VGAQRIARIGKDLSVFGRLNPRRTRVRLLEVVESAMRWLPASLGSHATVRVNPRESPEVRAPAGQIEQVVVNLVNNAARAIPEGRHGEMTIRLGVSTTGMARIDVIDNGAGIDPPLMERIFDPFFTTREAGQGMGLGLPICHAIVTAHGGTLTATTVPGEGSTFRVELHSLGKDG